MMAIILAAFLVGTGGQDAKSPSEGMLCSLAEALLVWSPPDGDDRGCIEPLAMRCGRGGVFASDGRAVVRFRYKGDSRARWAFPNAPCAARGIWLYKTRGRMPTGAHEYLQVFLDNIRPGEIEFDLTLGAPPEGTFGCGEFHGVAQYKNGKWELFSVRFTPDPERRIPVNPNCQFTKEQVFNCSGGGPTSR
jgi:hypothetical protein